MPHRRLLYCRFLPLTFVSASLVSATLTAPSARAQDTSVVTQRGGGPQTFGRPASLADALKTLPFNWDTSEKGVLLSISLDPAAEPARLKRSSFESGIRAEPLRLGANGYRLQDLATYYDRTIVSTGTLTVLAPTLTTVLATRLPKPDLYSDLGTNEKLRRLESTLTPAQWRLLASPTGLGESDLKAGQKSLWASLLPNPLNLRRTRNEKGRAVMSYEPNAAPTTLTEAQRSGVRLTLYRTLSWTFTTTEGNSRFGGPGANISVGTNSATGPDGTETLSLADASYMWRWDNPQTKLFGAVIKDVIPARSKPSDLAYDNAALDARVSLADAKTVGDLVAQAKEKTGVDVYCDPRFRSLTFWTKGGESGTVRAGDLLKALSLGVSGTFRRVFDGTAAYVLTDDLEGLGTRQARINEWAQAAAAAQRDSDDALVETALAKTSIGDYVGWREGDPVAPTGDLAQRIEAFRNGKVAPTGVTNQTDGTNTGLWISVSDLPSLAQETVKQQVEGWNRSMEEEQKRNTTTPSEFIFHRAPLRADRVKLSVQTGMAFLVPGVGRVEAGNGMVGGRTQSLLPTPPSRPQPFGITSPKTAANQKAKQPVAPEESAPFRLSQAGGTVRALIIALPQNVQAVQDAVSVAKASGFNELWVETLPTGEKKPEMLTQTIASAKASGLRVQVVVRPLRRSVQETPTLSRDRNLLSETLTEWAARRAASDPIAVEGLDATSDLSYFSYTARQQNAARQNALRQKDAGDYLDAGSPGVEAAVSSDLAALSQTPDLAGIVVKDFPAPGRDGTMQTVSYGMGADSVVGSFGYTPALRLGFLRQTGIDPVDLSPLGNGQVSLPYGIRSMSGPSPNIGLPQLTDYGPMPQNSTINGVSALTIGAKNGWQLWNTFRAEQSDVFWKRLQKRYASQSAAGVPLLRQNENNGSVYNGPVYNGSIARVSWTGTWDKTVPVSPAATPPSTPATARPAPPQPRTPQQDAASFLSNARQKSSRVLLTFRYDPTAQNPNGFMPPPAPIKTPPSEAERFVGMMTGYLRYSQSGWDGFVLDLSSLPVASAVEAVRAIPADKPADK